MATRTGNIVRFDNDRERLQFTLSAVQAKIDEGYDVGLVVKYEKGCLVENTLTISGNVPGGSFEDVPDA